MDILRCPLPLVPTKAYGVENADEAERPASVVISMMMMMTQEEEEEGMIGAAGNEVVERGGEMMKALMKIDIPWKTRLGGFMEYR